MSSKAVIKSNTSNDNLSIIVTFTEFQIEMIRTMCCIFLKIPKINKYEYILFSMGPIVELFLFFH